MRVMNRRQISMLEKKPFLYLFDGSTVHNNSGYFFQEHELCFTPRDAHLSILVKRKGRQAIPKKMYG